jgi:hypothetical protein
VFTNCSHWTKLAASIIMFVSLVLIHSAEWNYVTVFAFGKYLFQNCLLRVILAQNMYFALSTMSPDPSWVV